MAALASWRDMKASLNLPCPEEGGSRISHRSVYYVCDNCVLTIRICLLQGLASRAVLARYAPARRRSASVLPSRAGDGDTVIPAASIAAIFDSASPLPPAMIAPAWPMRRPGGAVRPAM